MKRVLAASVVIALLASCGGDSDTPPTVVGRGNRDSGPSEDRDTGPAEETGPVIDFVSPEAAKTPDDAAVLTDRMVSVRCKVTRRPGGRPVDKASVDISLDRMLLNGMTEKIRSTVAPLSDDQYESKFDLSALPNGTVRFTCLAKEEATSNPKSATETLTTLLDLGPAVEVTTPEDRTSYALMKPVPIQFKVEPSPLAEDDENAAIGEVKLQVSGIDFPISESDEPSVYRTSIDFNDKSLFAVAPSAAEVLITARNKRMALRSVKLDIRLDGDGPMITVASPTANTIVHGEINLRVTATDPAGIKAGTLKAVFKGVKERKDLVIESWKAGPEGSSEQLVDTVAFDDDLNQVTIQITATDGVDNITTRPHILRLDNMPPVVSLDPPPMREWRKSEDKYFCSSEFDPVGDDAANDRAAILPSMMFRAFVEDRTNEAPGDRAPTYAGVATDRVEIFIQGETGTPLLIDKDGDGTCDEINADPSTNMPTKLLLTALSPRGGAWYPKMPAFSLDFFNETGNAGQCTNDPNGAEAGKSPTAFCGNTAMYRAIPGRGEDKPPAIYGLNPTNGDMSNCQGEVWMISFAGTGWACLAARAEDRIGNVGVSEPLRACVMAGLNDTTTPCLPGRPEHDSPPSCTDGCTIAESQKFPSLIRQAR